MFISTVPLALLFTAQLFGLRVTLTMSVPVNAEIISEALESSQAVAVGALGFTILVWDHAITFADEVEIIWGRPKKLCKLVYIYSCFNRYLTPIGFIVNLVGKSEHLSYRTVMHRCRHFVRYEGAMTAIGIQVVGLMMFLRVRAMYCNNRYVTILVASLFLVWVAVGAWLLSHGMGECRSHLLCNSGSAHLFASAWAWVPLCYDTVIFALTLSRTLPSIQNKEAGHIVHTLFTDGVLFYSVMCAINLIFTIMIVRAPSGLKNITGQYVFYVTMMSRITLSLKKEGTRNSAPLDIHLRSKFPVCFGFQKPVQDITKLQSPTPSSRTSPMRTELFETQGHAGALDGDVSSQGQRDSEVCASFTCPAVTATFRPADDEYSRHQEAIV
ncbi:hypothetical protein BDR07DRAFT_1545710 [Suillus spraguei]|nr:hypothetical protein BDR07DRAFT_1545710 [Suillus spraguei]